MFAGVHGNLLGLGSLSSKLAPNLSVPQPGVSLKIRPTVTGLLRRDFPSLGMAVLMPAVFVFSFFVPSYRPWWAVIGLAAFAVAGAVLFIRAARSYIATDGEELRSRTLLTRSVSCRVSDLRGMYLTNEGVIFGMTRPWRLSVDLPFGERKCLADDVKRFAWLDVFRLADALGRRCEGAAMPYLAFVVCGSRRLPTERGTLAPGATWSLVERLIHDGATGKLILNGRLGESWLYFIRGRNLRLEEDWPRDVTLDMVSTTQAYEFQPSALTEDEISMVLESLEDKWLGASRPAL